ncbi:MAG: EthD family reductase [Gammaproteobacteria bacterium]|nr:EthD family reductase [Gammaproteobacteria bacterium]
MSITTGFKHVGLLQKRKEDTFEQFVSYWEQVHTEIALQLPGLKGYVLNPIDRRKYPDSPIDGFSELWFDSLADAEKAFASPVGKKAYDDVSNFIAKLSVTYITEIKKR